MARYLDSLDGPLDVDAGPATRGSKDARWVPRDDYQRRAAERLGARGLDGDVETMPAQPGTTRATRDALRAYPRADLADLAHPRMRRRLPAAGQTRTDLSSRQKKARSRTKRAIQDQMPHRQYTAMRRLIDTPDTWHRLNRRLSEVTGDAQLLDDNDRLTVQRIDRAIGAYERTNDRGHLVYVNARLPTSINHANIAGFVDHEFTTGRTISFDRFSMATHTLHQAERQRDDPGRTLAFEIQTRRGIYLGGSDTVDDTAHLLPRGMRLRVTGTQTARYRRPDGTHGETTVVQLVDTDEQQGRSTR